MISNPWQRWTIVAFVLSLSLCSLDRAWSQQVLTSEQRMKRDITYLASDECEGRGPGTKGLDKAADYIVKQFADAGLKPGGVKGSWFQPFTIPGSAAQLEDGSIVKLQGPGLKDINLKLGDEFQILGNSGSGKVSAGLVFAGYGATAKDYDDFKDIDVKGKVVVLIRRVPRWDDKDRPFDGKAKDAHASIEKKLGLAEKHKAAAVLLINDRSEKDDKLIPFKLFTSANGRSIPVANVSRSALEPVFKSGLGKSLAEIEKAIDDDLKPLSAPFKEWSATVECDVKRVPFEVKNVIGVLEGSGPLANETVVVGAHYDHLGYGGFGSRAPGQVAIHHGADDNASGSTSVMELARRLAAIKDRKGRRIVFMTFSGEERGLLGSRHYCGKDPLFPLDKTVAMVNLDMVGRLPGDKDNKGGKLIVEGLGTGKGFEFLIDEFNKEAGFQLIKKQGGTGPSDHDSFFRQKVPVFFFWNGTHPEYHTPKDTSDLINVPGMKRIADLAERVIVNLSSDPQRREFVEVAGTPIVSGPKGPRLGILPDYESKDGLKIDGVTPDSIAAKAGLKTGDTIVEIAGQKVQNINTYMTIMASQKAGSTIEISVMREKKKLTVKATLK